MPTTNPFFSTTTGYTGEQQLIDDLVVEQIGIFGVDLMYMPRKNINLDKLLHESTKSAFEMALSIPMYIKSFDGYDNSIEMLSKFGVRSSDEIILQMSKSQWKTYYGPYIKSYNNANTGNPDQAWNDRLDGVTAERPKEGDLIYFPFDGGIFEVKYVMFDQPFFQLGKNYVFELQCEKFEYSGEDFTTGIIEIDKTERRADFYTLQLDLDEGGLNTFKSQEKVTLYDLSDASLLDLATESGQWISTDQDKLIRPDNLDWFRLYNDSGFLHEVKTVEGVVLHWNKPGRKLELTDLTNLDPNMLDEHDNPVLNKFDTVLVIGQESGAQWISTNATEVEKPFDDSKIIQAEFDSIHIVDPGDEAPFGFL